MKRTNVRTNYRNAEETDSSPSMNCSCQILNDTSLSNIGDSDCDCSQCLEANLNAFNQFKNDEEYYTKTAKQNNNIHRGKSAAQRGKNQGGIKRQDSRFRSTQKINRKQQKARVKWGEDNEQGSSSHNESDYERYDITYGNINEYLLVTKNRIRHYIEQRNKLQKQQQEQKDNLKDKIKKNLQILKYNALANQHSFPNQCQHPYKWNHSQYQCQCNCKKKSQKHQCCRLIKVKEKLDTGLGKLKENFHENRDQILNEKKEQRIAEINKPKGLCEHDNCLNHHNRTDQKKIKKIQKFIEKQAKKYQQSLKQKKRKEQEERKVKEAKLRAIDIKSKEIVGKCKKFDENQSRTSFHLSIDHYDTFSELRQEDQRKRKAKKNQQKVKKNLKEGGGELQNAIYEELNQQQQDYPRPGENIILKKTTKGQMTNVKGNKQFSERILYDARISSPNNIKKKTVAQKQQKIKKNKNLSKGKQQEQRKKLKEEIQRKKMQIANEYSKRNTHKQPANKRLREDYEKQGAKKQRSGEQQQKKKESTKDPYRKNYKYEAGKDINQINTHGDPLLQEYVYHDGQRLKAAASVKDDQIFTQNINSLTGKNKLRL